MCSLISDSLHSFLYMWISIWCHFATAWRIPVHMSYSTGLEKGIFLAFVYLKIYLCGCCKLFWLDVGIWIENFVFIFININVIKSYQLSLILSAVSHWLYLCSLKYAVFFPLANIYIYLWFLSVWLWCI